MAPPTKKAKTLNKDDLRKLMKEHKTTTLSSKKKIDSPLAKYNSLGQLVCVVCNSTVKTELLWNSHLLSRTHKENLARLKEVKETPKVEPPPPPKVPKSILKTKSCPISSVVKQLPQSAVTTATTTVPTTAGTKRPHDHHSINNHNNHSTDNGTTGDGTTDMDTTPAAASNTLTSGLPPDFFDSSMKPPPSQDSEEEGGADDAQPGTSIDADIAEKLPEGFFDDPKVDAKVRKVEYKDKLDEELELFQREIKQQTTISMALEEEDNEEIQAERELEINDDMMRYWSTVDKLQKDKESSHPTEDNNKPDRLEDGGDDSSSDIGEEELEEMIDWRVKRM